MSMLHKPFATDNARRLIVAFAAAAVISPVLHIVLEVDVAETFP